MNFHTIGTLWKQLNKTDLKLLELLSFLSKEKGWCQPSRKYLAETLGVTVWTISRHITKLSKNHQFKVIHRSRKRKDGTFDPRTNLYIISPALAKRIGKIKKAIKKCLRFSQENPVKSSYAAEVRENAHIPTKKELSINNEEDFSFSFPEEIKKIKDKQTRTILGTWWVRGQE